MRAYVITLAGHRYSQAVAQRCIESAAVVGGLEVEPFEAVTAEQAPGVMREHGLTWTWAGHGHCPITGLKQHPYGGGLGRVGCAMSHYRLWLQCLELDEPLLILEHDAVFLRRFQEFGFNGLCQVNDPAGATRRGQWWSERMAKRGPGIFPATWVTDPADRIPDGLAGNSAYVIKPFAAAELVDLYYRLGVWPNDATMCKQLLPYLEELYPWVTRVQQSQSTTTG